jgi:cyclase
MILQRVIPVLLLKNKGLVKSIKFAKTTYVGDPINAIKIFNDKEVDELVFLDIKASKEKREPDFDFLESIASECFMPLGYGGGISNLDQVKKIFKIGIEKVILNQICLKRPEFVKEVASEVGNQSVVVSIDVKKNLFGKYKVYDHAKASNTDLNPLDFAKKMEDLGAGEIILNSVDNDGMMQGFDIPMIRNLSDALKVPVVACGGAGKLVDIQMAIADGHASAVAAGSMFVFHGPHKAVLINYPKRNDLIDILRK